jgi:hypothetical protein
MTAIISAIRPKGYIPANQNNFLTGIRCQIVNKLQAMTGGLSLELLDNEGIEKRQDMPYLVKKLAKMQSANNAAANPHVSFSIKSTDLAAPNIWLAL